MAKVFVTGGTGFMGSHIVELLLQEGHQITVLTSSSSIHPNIQHLQAKIKIVRGDFGNYQLMLQYLQDTDIIVHIAWTTVPKTASENPIYDAQTNIIGSIHLLEAAVKAKVKKVLFVSTGGALYGVPQYTPIDEAHPIRPISAYGISKMAFERYLHFFYQNKGLDYGIFRIANAYGTRQNLTKNQGVIGIWLQKIKENKAIEIWGDGSVVRDYIYVSDVAQIIAKGMHYQGTQKVFNVGSGLGYSLNDILNVCKKVSQKNPRVAYLNGRSFDVPVNILSIQKAVEELDWQPNISIEEGVQATWDWLTTL
ncbi:MAG: UDP-glucose 4-epimerase (EC [uncultured Aureispira sp.]|uniref:UDP-glucose 4-epimerase (EC) n=1 Tax=uncultured Aureispira sp. TaxID=1331704 RepID=A0A6S6TNE4_9BACT|nr:MAG: UDP-glucose 4-epimerase (EC [uncultured Aureispira sp.]